MWQERIADPFGEPERLTVADAFLLHAEMDLLSTVTEYGADARRFAAMAMEGGVRVASDDTWGDVFSRVLTERVEPYLGLDRATILDEYPAVMSALARPKASDPRVSERFELYICGVELANGFGIDIQPQVANGMVYLSSAALLGGGVVYALDADTGKLRWSFDTVIDPVGNRLRSWEFIDVFPVRWAGPDFSVESRDPLEEELEVAHHGFRAVTQAS